MIAVLIQLSYDKLFNKNENKNSLRIAKLKLTMEIPSSLQVMNKIIRKRIIMPVGL